MGKRPQLPTYAYLVGLSLAISGGGCGGGAAESSGVSTPAGGALIGKKAPDFTVATMVNGKGKVALEELRGKVVLLDFWAAYCEPCRRSFPKLQDLHARYEASGLQIVGISEDDAETKNEIPGFASTFGAKFTLGWDEDKSIARSYNAPAIPSSFLIDRSGIVRYAHAGYHDGEEVAVERQIEELLAR
jgi:cytochrome c biogenesis protein CcmG, thiol:disulfide interchange protein DsbE